ncbi:MAG: SoxR reducing system RseC family protein [Sedimenticolaceae bacterium]
MIEERGRVLRAAGGWAQVAPDPDRSCGSCAAQGGCSTKWLTALFPKRELTFFVDNRIGARPGDAVVVGVDEQLLQRSSLLLYALPLAGLLAGGILGESVFSMLGAHPELGGILGGLTALSAALAFVRRRSAARAAGDRHGVRLLRIMQPPTAYPLGGLGMPPSQSPHSRD